MSGWIWMKGVKEALADPIEPVCPEDERESVKALIDKHRDKIDKVKEGIQNDPLYDSIKHDDLWILRFVLSHKFKSKPAIKAAKHTLEFRQKHKLDEKDIRSHPPHKVKEGNIHEYWQKRCNGEAIVITHPDPKRGILMYLHFGSMNPDAHDGISETVWDQAFIYSSEYAHQWLDYTTRTTGLLTRSIRIIDMRGVTRKHFSRGNTKRDGKSEFDVVVGCDKFSLLHTLQQHILTTFHTFRPAFFSYGSNGRLLSTIIGNHLCLLRAVLYSLGLDSHPPPHAQTDHRES
jgi:hypothetical protein